MGCKSREIVEKVARILASLACRRAENLHSFTMYAIMGYSFLYAKRRHLCVRFYLYVCSFS